MYKEIICEPEYTQTHESNAIDIYSLLKKLLQVIIIDVHKILLAGLYALRMITVCHLDHNLPPAVKVEKHVRIRKVELSFNLKKPIL